MRKKWPDEVIQWLEKNVPGKTTKEVTKLINEQGFDRKYGMVFTESMIKGAKNRYGIQSGTPTGFIKGAPTDLFPAHVKAFISENHIGVGPKEMAVLLNEKFGTDYTMQQMKSYYGNNHINSGLDGRFPKGHVPASKGRKMSPEQYEKCRGTMFKKGDVPHNTLQIGECTHTTEGYLIRKVSNSGKQSERFEMVHRATWEKHNGPIPPGKIVTFLDGDKDNCDIENLVMIDRQENIELCRSGLRFDNADLTRAGLAVAKVNVAIAQRKKRRAKA